MPRKNLKVSLDKEKLKAALQQRICEAIGRHVAKASFSHTNTDGHYSPAEWWVGENLSPPRHKMTTSGNMTWANNTLTVNLTYTIETL